MTPHPSLSGLQVFRLAVTAAAGQPDSLEWRVFADRVGDGDQQMVLVGGELEVVEDGHRVAGTIFGFVDFDDPAYLKSLSNKEFEGRKPDVIAYSRHVVYDALASALRAAIGLTAYEVRIPRRTPDHAPES